MNHHNAIDRFAQRGLKAQQAVDEVIEKISRRPGASSPGTGSTDTRTTTVGTPPVAATQGKRDAEGAPGSASSRPVLSGDVTVQQIRWSNDQVWLRRLMVDKDRAPWIRTEAQKRLRKLGRRKPRL